MSADTHTLNCKREGGNDDVKRFPPDIKLTKSSSSIKIENNFFMMHEATASPKFKYFYNTSRTKLSLNNGGYIGAKTITYLSYL